MADFNKDISFAYAENDPQGSSEKRRRDSAIQTNPWWKFGGRDRSFIPTRAQTSQTSLDKQQHSLDKPDQHRDIEDENTADDSVFNNAKAFDIYKPIDKYEGRHRFDPRATWSEAEEKKLVRRVSQPMGHATTDVLDSC